MTRNQPQLLQLDSNMSNRLASEHGMRLSSDRGWVYNDEAAQQRSNNGRVDTLTRMDTVRRPVRPRQMNSYNNSNWNSTDGGGTVGPMYFDPNLQKWRSHRESDEELLDLPSDNASQSTINQSFDGEQHLARDTGYRSRPLLQDGAGSYGRRYGSPQSSQASGLSPSNSQLYHELNQVMSPGSDSAGNNGSPQRYYAENSDGVGIYDDDGTDIDADHESYRYNPRHAKDYPPSYSTYASDQRHHTHAHVHAEARAAEEDEAHARRYDQSQAQVDEQVQARMRRSARTKARESTFELGDTTHNNTQHTEVYHNHNSNGSGSGSDRSFASVQSQSGQLTRKAVGYGHAYRGAQARGPVAPTHPQIAAPRSRTYNPRNTYLMDNRRREGGEADYANTIENGVQGYYGDINNATEVERVGGDMGYQSWPAHNYTQAERYRSEGNHHSHRRGSGREDSGDSLDLARGTNHLVDYRNPKHPKVQGITHMPTLGSKRRVSPSAPDSPRTRAPAPLTDDAVPNAPAHARSHSSKTVSPPRLHIQSHTTSPQRPVHSVEDTPLSTRSRGASNATYRMPKPEREAEVIQSTVKISHNLAEDFSEADSMVDNGSVVMRTVNTNPTTRHNPNARAKPEMDFKNHQFQGMFDSRGLQIEEMFKRPPPASSNEAPPATNEAYASGVHNCTSQGYSPSHTMRINHAPSGHEAHSDATGINTRGSKKKEEARPLGLEGMFSQPTRPTIPQTGPGDINGTRGREQGHEARPHPHRRRSRSRKRSNSRPTTTKTSVPSQPPRPLEEHNSLVVPASDSSVFVSTGDMSWSSLRSIPDASVQITPGTIQRRRQVGPINDQLTTNPTTTLTPRTAASKSPGFWQDHPEFEGRSTHSNQVLKRLKYFTTDPVAPFEESSPNNTPTRSTDVKPTLDLSRAEIASLSRFHRPVRFQFLSNIQTLTLAYNFLSDIKPLAGSLPALQVLDLSYNQLTYMDVETFASLPLLRWLSLDGNDFASSRLAFNPSGENQDRLVATVPSLQALSLRNNELQSIRVHGVSFARAFPNLQDLNVDSNSITTLDLRELRSLRAVSIANNLLGRSADPRSVDLHLADWAHECLWLPDTTERVVVDHNYLQSITGLLCLPNLKVLKASNNRLSFTGTREGSEANDTRAHAQGSIHSTLNERSPRRHFQFRLPNGTSPLRVLDLSNNHYSTLDFLTAQAKPFDAIDHSGTHPSRTHALAQTQAYSFHKLAVLLANNNRLERRECVLNIVQHLPELAYLDTRDNPFLLTTLFSAAKRSEMPVDGLTGTLRVSDTSKHPTHPRPYSDSPSRQGTHTLTHTHTREDTGLLYTGLASDLAVPFRDARIKLGERVVDARVAVTSSTVQIDKFISTLPVPQKQAFLQHRRDVRTLAHHGSTTKLQFLDGFIVLPGVEDKQLIAMNATSFTPSVPDHTQPPPKDQMRAHGSNQNGSLSAKIQPSAIATAKHSNTHSPSAQEGSEFPSLSKLARALASVKDPARAHGLSSMYATTVPTVATEANGRSNHGMHADAHNGSTLPQEGDVEHTKDSTGSTNRPQGSSPIDPNSGDVSFMKLPTLSSTAGDVGVTGPAGNGPDGVHNMPASLNLNRMHCESGRAKPELGMAMSSNATGLPERGTTWAASGQAQRIPAKECGTVGPGGPISFVHVSDANEPDTAQRLGGNSWNSPRVQTHSKLRETSTRSPSPISTNVYAPSSSHLATDTYTYTQPETAHPRTRLQPVPTAYGGQLRSTVPPSPPSDEQLLATLSSDSLRDAVRRFLGVTKSDSTRHTGNCMNHCTRVHADDMSHQRRANVHVSAAPSPLKTNNKTDASIYAHATTPSRPSAGSRSTYAYANGGPLGFTPESAGETPTTVGGDTPLHQETPASASGTVGTNYSPRANIEFEEDTPKANSGSNSRPRMSQQADAPHEGTGREGTGFKAPLRHRRDKRSDYAEDTDTINAASGRERNRNSGMNSGTRMSPASAGYDNEALEMELEYTDDSDTRGSSGTRRRPHRRDSNPPSNTDEDRRVRNSPRREGKRRTGQAVISAERVDSSVAVAGEKGWPHVPAGFGRSATLIKSYMQDSNTIDATTRRRESSLLELESVLDIHDPRLQSNGRYIGRSNKKKDYSAAPSRLNQDKIKSSRGTRRGPIQPLNDHSQQTLYNQAHARDYDQDSNNLGTRDNPQGRQRSGRQSVVFHDDVEMLGSPRTSNGGGSHSMSDELLYSSRVLHNRPHMTQIRPVTSPAPQMRSAIYRGRNTGVGYGYTQTRGTSTAAKMDSGRNTGDSQKADIVVPQCTDSSRLLKMMRRLSAELGSDQQQSGPPPVNAVVKGGSYECDTVRGYIEDMCKCTPSVMKSYNDVLNIRITQLTRTFSPDRLERFERIGGGTSEFLNDLGSSSGVGASQSKLHALIYADTGKTLARLVKHGFSVRSSTTAPLILEAGVSRAVSFAQQNNSRGTVSCLLVLANLGMCCTNFSGDYKDFMQSWETQTVELLTKGYDSVRLAIRADARGPRGDTAYVYVLFSHFRLAAIYSCIFTLQ